MTTRPIRPSPPGIDLRGRGGPLRVMLVDDHALIRSAVRNALEGPDLVVVAEAATASEALERIHGARPEVVVVDVDLGGMTGLELVRELAPRLPSTTFVMLSVSAREADVLEAIMAGAAGYLTKDMSPDALVRTIRSARRGELAVPRLLGARLVRRLADAVRDRGGLAEPGLVGLSAREGDVLRLLGQGLTDREIAAALSISPRTAETHVAAILRKLRVRNRSEAAVLYGRRGVLVAPSGDARL